MDGCVFCGIAAGKIPAKLVYQDEQIVVFPDIKPKANLHLLIVSNKHETDLLGAPEETVRAIFEEIARLVKENDLINRGYRLVVNGGLAKAIPHLHIHVMGDIKPERGV